MTEEMKDEWEHVNFRMEEEGFHYCFVHYSNFLDIKDEKFHKLRKEYIQASDKLYSYVRRKFNE